MNLENSAKIILKKILAVKKGEKVLVITDNELEPIGEVLFNTSRKITKTAFLKIPIGTVSGAEPSKDVADEMLKFNVILAPTVKSLTHTNAAKAAAAKGARIATLPGITKEIMERCIDIDYLEMAKRTNKLKDILDKGKQVRITTKAGTDITLSIDQRKAEGTQRLANKGSIGNLPTGEAFIAPVEGTADGKYVIDGSVLGKKVTKPIIITVEDGFAVKISDDELRKTLKSIKNKNAFNIAELGIGTNDKAILTGNVLEDEKVLGTAHIALGKNSSFGGMIDVPVHLDGVFKTPTIYIDDVKIIENGRIL